MLARALSCAMVGLDSALVEVEVDLSQGLPAYNIVGLPDTAVNEAKERVRAAIRNSGLQFPMRRITVNLAPADLRKEGPSYDLPMAVALRARSRSPPRTSPRPSNTVPAPTCRDGAVLDQSTVEMGARWYEKTRVKDACSRGERKICSIAGPVRQGFRCRL